MKDNESIVENGANRRSFLKTGFVAAATTTLGTALLPSSLSALGKSRDGDGTSGDRGECGGVSACPSPTGTGSTVRRYVIGTDTDKASFVEFSGCATVSETLGSDGFGGTLWKTATTPVDNTGTTDTAVGPSQPILQPNETLFAFVSFGKEGTPKHSTATIDYVVILEGEVTLTMDKDEIHLKEGDTVVIRGANHAWSRTSDKPCLAVVASIYATPLTSFTPPS